MVYRYAEHAYSDDGFADAECGEYHRFSAAGLRGQDDGGGRGTRYGHRPMVGLPHGVSAFPSSLSSVGQV